MIQNDEVPGPPSASDSRVDECVKCGTSYSSKVEFVQHLLLHIERTYPVVTLNRDDVDKFEENCYQQKKMSAEGETEVNQVEEVETKPKLNNNFDSHADSNDVSSAKDGERRGSVSGDDDTMSICSSVGTPAQAPPEVPKLVVKAEVHAADAETAQTGEANGRPSSESSQGKDQSGAEDDDDGTSKTSDGSKSPAKPTTPSLPFAITLRKSEDLMAQTNYNLIQKRLRELYKKCQGTRIQDSPSAGLSDINATDRVGSGIGSGAVSKGRAVSSNRNDQGGSEVAQTSRHEQASTIQSAAAQPSSTVNETQEDYYDATPKLSECETESSGELPLTPSVNAQIDAVLKDIDFSRLPDHGVDGIDSDSDIGLHIVPEDCDWPDEIEKLPDDRSEVDIAEPNPPPAPVAKKVGQKPKISDYFAVARKSGTDTKSSTTHTQIPKSQPKKVPAPKQDKQMSVYCSDVKNGQGMATNTSPETTTKNVSHGKSYTSFEGVLGEEKRSSDDFDNQGFNQNGQKLMPPTNLDRVPSGSMPAVNVPSGGGVRDPRTTRKQATTDYSLDEGSKWEENVRRKANSSAKPPDKFGGLRPVMTERFNAGSQNSIESVKRRLLKPVLTDASFKRGEQMDNPTFQRLNTDSHNVSVTRVGANPCGKSGDGEISQDNLMVTTSQSFKFANVDARYARIMRNLGHNISLSVTPSVDNQRSANQKMDKQASTQRQGDANVGIPQSNKGGARFRTHVPTSSVDADFRDDSNLGVADNPKSDALLPLEGTSKDAKYDQQIKKLGNQISLSVTPSVDNQRCTVQKMQKPASHQSIARQGGANVCAAQSSTGAINSERPAQILPRSSRAASDDSCSGKYDFGEAQSDNGDVHERHSQTRLATGIPTEFDHTKSDVTNAVANYDQKMKNLGRDVCVTPSLSNRRTAASKIQKHVPVQMSGLGQRHNEEDQINNGRVHSSPSRTPRHSAEFTDDRDLHKDDLGRAGIRKVADSQTSTGANIEGDPDKEVTDNPTNGDDHQLQVDGSSTGARCDRKIQHLVGDISQSVSPNDRKTPKQDPTRKSCFGRGKSRGRGQRGKSAMIAGEHAQTCQSSVAADIRGDQNQAEFREGDMVTEYHQDAENLTREISMSMPESMNSQRLTAEEIDDLIASALQGRAGMVISKMASTNQDFTELQSTFQNPHSKGKSVANPEESGYQRLDSFTETRSAPDKDHHSQANNPPKDGDQKRQPKSKKTPRPPKNSTVNLDDGNSIFESQPFSESSSDVGSQPIGTEGVPALSSTDLLEPKAHESDSGMLEVKNPKLPPFIEAFPSVTASVVGKEFALPTNDNVVPPASASQGAFKHPAQHRLPPVAPTARKSPKIAVQQNKAPTPSTASNASAPIQHQNKDREWRKRRRRMWRRAEMRRKKISLKLSKQLTNATKNSRTNSLTMLSDSDSSESFEVKWKPKSEQEALELRRSSRNPPVKTYAEENPDDFIDNLYPTGLSPPKPLTPVSVSTQRTFTPEKSYTNLQPLNDSFHQDPLDNSENPSHPYPSQEDFPNGDFHNAQKDLYRCAICPRSFVSAAELDAHAVADGHIICSMSEACASLSFDSPASLSHHQAMVHQAPVQTTAVQRLAAQVERLPQTFGSYPAQGPPQPFGGPSPYNLPSTTFNGPKLGSQVVLTPMASTVVAPPPPAPPSLPNLPGIQLTKRPAPPPVDSSPNKMTRGDNGMPSIRLPDSITLVKSQPAPPPQNTVADILATRGITMVASGSRAGPTPATSLQPVAPAKRLPNVPSAISIVPSRAQPSQQAQRFAVPPAPPQQRGRHVTNLGTVDLTRDEQNGRMRGGPGRPIMPNSPRRFSCTICDKAYPTGESLQAHMAVHGSNNKPGRYMCEICRVVYTNEAKLQHHKKTVHAVRSPADTEMVIPICDLNQPGVKEKLLQCGIRHIVLVQSIRNTSDTAVFGLPIIPIDLARNEAYSRLDDLGASNILSLGSLRNVYR